MLDFGLGILFGRVAFHCKFKGTRIKRVERILDGFFCGNAEPGKRVADLGRCKLIFYTMYGDGYPLAGHGFFGWCVLGER